MTLRLVGGELRSRRIRAPRGAAVRPTPGRVKEALFSMLGDRVVDAHVLDLYAGTGAVGFEALSRGAADAVFVERHAPTAAAIRAAARALGVEDRVRVVRSEVERTARFLGGRYDFVYADPPYAAPAPIAVLARLREQRSIDAETIVVYEHRSDRAADPGWHEAGFITEREARYGEVALHFLRSHG